MSPRETKHHGVPQARSREPPRQHGPPGAAHRRGLHRRPPSEPLPRLLGGVRRVPPVQRGGVGAQRRLEDLREDRPLLREGLRGRDEPARDAARRPERVDGFHGGRRGDEAALRDAPRRRARLSHDHAARRRGARRVRREDQRARAAPVGAAAPAPSPHDARGDRARREDGDRAGAPRDGGAHQAPRARRAFLRSLRRPRAR